MKKLLFGTTYLYGIIPNIKKPFNDFDIFKNDSSLPSVFLKKIKIWYGVPKEKCPKCLLGIKCWYINYLTYEEKESQYHGCELNSDNIESKEIEVNNNDYFTKINIGYNDFITHFKITTKNGKFIEFGEIEEDFEKIIGMNLNNNMILFFSGYFSPKGIRAIRIKYINRKNFIYYRIFDILGLRYIFKKEKEKKDFYLDEINYNKLDNEMKCLLKVCTLPDTIFSSILKYI